MKAVLTNKNCIQAAAIVMGAALLLVPVALNGFPFYFPNSGDYLVFTPHLYRSPFYGLFIAFFHLNRWIWMPIVAQALITSHVLWTLLRLHQIKRPALFTVIICGLLTLFSSLPYFVGFIMADLFTPIMFLTMYILAFHLFDLSWSERIYFVLLTTISMSSHVANLTMAMGMIFLLAVLLLWYKEKKILQRLGVILLSALLTAAAFFAFNLAIFGIPAISPAGNSFFMANLIEYGPARNYLNKACPQAGYKICAYVDQLPTTPDEQFIWTTNIFDRLGGFVGMRDESKDIVIATIKNDPRRFLKLTADNFLAGLTTHTPADEFRPEYQIDATGKFIAQKFGIATGDAYASSAEMQGKIPHELIQLMDDIEVPLYFFSLIAFGLYAAWRHERKDAAYALLMLCAVLGNTFLFTTVSGVHSRYQARVTWLLPLALLMMAISQFENSKQRIRPKQKTG